MALPQFTGAAVTRKEYNRHTLVEWKQVKLRSLIELRNANITIPAGTVLTVHDKASGFTLTAKACTCCGVEIHIRKVEPYCVAVALEEDNSKTQQENPDL